MLPTITVSLRRRNPEWKPIYENGSPRAINTDTYYVNIDTEVEIVQLNLNTGGMRVRWCEPDSESKKGYVVESRDISIDHFYKKYAIQEL